MYTPEQYAKAKAALDDPGTEAKVGPERMGKWAEKIAEYEAAQAPVAQPAEDHGFEPEPSIADFQSVQPDETRDANLPNASKLKRFKAPPEYVSKSHSPLSVIAKNTLLDPLAGPASTMYFEPSEQQFQADLGPYLQAKGVQPGSEDYLLAYAEYKDRKWEQAYAAAAAEDRPLTRHEYVRGSSGWEKLSNTLGQLGDSAAAFAHGYVNGLAPGAAQAASGASDALTGRDEVSADRERAARNPGASAVGEFMGSINPRSIPNKVAGLVGRVARPALGRFGAAGLAGAAGADTQILGNAGGQALADQLHGRPMDRDLKNQFAARLLAGSMLGTGAGVFGEGVATAAQKYRGAIRSATSDIGPELTNAEASGTATDLLSGLKPSSDVREMLERARGPVPGEAKLPPSGSAVEYAAGRVRGPIVAQQVDERVAALKRMEEASGSMYSRDPQLQKPRQMNEVSAEVLRELLDRGQPGTAALLPETGEALAGRNNGPLQAFSRAIHKPRLVALVDAGKEAARTGGRVVTLEQAQRAGFKVKGLENEINPETGLPHNAPPLSEYDRVTDGDLLPDANDMSRATRVDNDRATFVDDGMLEPPAPIGPAPANDAHGVVFGAGGQNDVRQAPTMARILALGGKPANSFAEIDPALKKAIGKAGLAANDIEVPEGYNPKNFRVILEPHAYDAMKMEQQLQAIDAAGKAGTEAKVDPIWPKLMRAARIDREQFGKAWAGLKAVHHEELTALEQRAAHAGITEDKYYPEMSGNAQKAANSAITNYGVAPKDTNDALTELADNAGVRPGLETLRGTRAYSALKEKAGAQAGVTDGGGFLRVGGLIPGAKLRLDALARGVTRGPEGNPLFMQQFNPAMTGEPLGRELLPSSGLLGMGRGALGVKTGSVYDSTTGRAKPAGTLSQQEREQLERLLAP